MKTKRTLISAMFTILALSASFIADAQTNAYLIEGEAFQFKGKWVEEKSSDCLGSAMLRVFQDKDDSPESDALTVVNIAESGNYNVWVRSRDYQNSEKPRTFTLTVDGVKMSDCGNHGVAGFYWQNVGNVTLDKKQVLLRLSDTGHYYGRCDAILIIKDNSINPNTLTNTTIAKWRKNPVFLQYETENIPQLPESREISAGYSTAASVSNDNIRISFVKLTDGTIVNKTDYYSNGSWRRYGGNAEDNRVAIIKGNDNCSFNHNMFYPSWNSCATTRKVIFDGVTYNVNIDGDRSNPFMCGELIECKARSVSKQDAQTIKVVYDCDNVGTLIGYWTVPESGNHVAVKFEFKANADGVYSVVMHGIKGADKATVSNVVMPPMFCGRRMPDTPLMLFSSMMSQCMTCVETDNGISNVCAFTCADLNSFSNDWGTYDYSPVGFTLKNSLDEYQPVAISPIPGMNDSKIKSGKTINANFFVGIIDKDWTSALQYISDNLFKVVNYRKADGCSLTKTLFNIATLINNDDYSGWNSQLKGFWDIEFDGNEIPTVVQSSPLSILGASILHDNEELYEYRALPSIEYALSRNSFRSTPRSPYTLNPYNSQFPTTLYEGINTLSGGLNPWLKEVAIPNGNVRNTKGYFSSTQLFRQKLSAYTMTGEKSFLDEAMTDADTYLAELLRGDDTVYSQGSFYNSQMCPEWTSLLDVYKYSGNKAYLDGARTGASYLLAGIKTWPMVAAGMLTVNPDNKYDGVTNIWWKGEEQFRLGFPRKDGDAPQHDVESWKVSSVGLGMEQPATYFVRTAGKNVRPVFMSSWAARMLELSRLDDNKIFEKYAANAIIGRAQNYPGYYATGYTDITSAADFPYVGPDVSSIYYHHIPAYYGLIQDYIVSDVISKSEGMIDFPASRQEGFVWFTNNLYGRASGEILGEDATLWMPDNLLEIDNLNINYLTAKNNNSFFLILSNMADSDQDFSITLNDEIGNKIVGTKANAYQNPTAHTQLTINGNTINLKLKKKGFVIVKFDAYWGETSMIPNLTDGMKVIETDTKAGKIYLYRIRSPFGWDSVYGYAESADASGLNIAVECNGTTKTANQWPLEWSFSKFGYDKDVKLNISIYENGTLKDTKAGEFVVQSSTITETQANPNNTNIGIYRLDGTEVMNTATPGFYIVNGRKVIKK